MDVKGVILDKQILGPHAAPSWKICWLHQQLRELEVSHILSIAHSVSLSRYMECTYLVFPCVEKMKYKTLIQIGMLHVTVPSVTKLSVLADISTEGYYLIHDTMNTNFLLYKIQYFEKWWCIKAPATHMLLKPNKYVWCHPASLLQGCADKQYTVNGILKYDIAMLSVELLGEKGRSGCGGRWWMEPWWTKTRKTRTRGSQFKSHFQIQAWTKVVYNNEVIHLFFPT